MTQGTTVGDLFVLAIAAEETTAEFYRSLVRKFSHESDIADYWQRYVLDEVSHALWLERLRSNLSLERLAEPADRDMLASAERARSVSVEKALSGIHNLDDAYEVVNDLENSETNVVFEFLIANFPYDREVLSFLRTQLTEHVNRLVTEFPARFRDPGARRAVTAQG
jgi:rubrerythrin